MYQLTHTRHLTLLLPANFIFIYWLEGWSFPIGYDHLPITITIKRNIEFVDADFKTHINFNKANWAGFTAHSELFFGNEILPTDVFSGEKKFRKFLIKCKKSFIPAGRIPKIRPNFPSAAALLADKRDEIRQNNPADIRIIELNRRISNLVNEHKKQKWLEHLSTATFNSGPKNLWKTVKGLTNKKQHGNNNYISFNNSPVINPIRCAVQSSIHRWNRLSWKIHPKHLKKAPEKVQQYQHNIAVFHNRCRGCHS